MKKTLLVTSLATTIALSLSSCGKNAQAEQTMKFKVDEPVVATVNNQNIGMSWYEIIASRAERIGITEKEQILEELTAIEALRQEALSQELHKDPKVQARLQHQQANVMADTLLKKFIDGLVITDEMLQESYKEIITTFTPQQEFNASHILLDGTDEEKAKDLIKQLENGADFAELAKTNSTGPTGPKGGNLGWFSPANMVKPFADAVAAMEKGSISKAPVKTQFGWHIIKLDDSRETKAPTMESMKPQLEEAVLAKKLEAYIDGIREKAAIKVHLDAFPSETKEEEKPQAEESKTKTTN